MTWPYATHGIERLSTSASPRITTTDPSTRRTIEPETGSEEVFESRREREHAPVRRLPTSRRSRRDEIDDIFADDEPIAGQPHAQLCGRSTTAAPKCQVHLVIPRNFNDAQQVADQFKRAGAGDPQPADRPTTSYRSG